MGKYRMTEPYGYSEPQGFDSVRSAVDSEINNNRKTDKQQSEDIQKESEINEEQAQQIEAMQTTVDEAQATAAEAKDAAEAAQATAESAQTAADEAKDAADAAQAKADENAEAIEVLNGDGDGSVKKMVEDAVAPYFDGAEYDSDAKKILFKHGDEVKAEIDATEFIKDGMIESVTVEDGNLIIKFNTESGIEPIEIPISDIFNADNYYTKDDVDALLEDKTNVADVYTKDEVDEKVAPLAVKSAVDEQINTEVAALTDAIETKAEKADVDAEMEKKVDWTVSEGERKHIVLKNHDSILGTALDGTTYNVAMVSKWDVADFGSAHLHLNLNSLDGIVTINDDKAVAVVSSEDAAEVISDISDAAVVDGDDIILSGGEF